MAVSDVFFPLAVAALLLVALVALRHRILAAVAIRNTKRRPRQTILIVLGLLVGSALVSAAFVTSDSMEYAIVQATYDSFLEIDETVYLDGYNFFPQSVQRDLASDAELADVTDAVGGNILWSAAVTNERTDLYEPGVRLVGFDPAADRPFGTFESGDERFTGETLATNEVVLDQRAAEQLDARIGDTLTLNFGKPFDPVLPGFQTLVGQVGVSATTGLPPPLGPQVESVPWKQDVSLSGALVRVSGVLAWDRSSGVDLDWELHDPRGNVYTNTTGANLAPDGVIIDVPGSLADPLSAGEWTIRVFAKTAAQTAFNVTIASFEPIYDPDAFQKRVKELRQQFPDFEPDQLRGQGPLAQETRTVRVAFISEGGKAPNFKLPTPLNLYLRLDVAQDWLDRKDQVNFVKVSNLGGVEEGGDRTDEALPVLEDRLDATKQKTPDHPAIQSLKANDDKVFWLGQAEEVGEQFSVFLVFLSSFAVLAGLLLIVNIFTMLAEERKAELGISRAVGLRRKHLTRVFTIEGAIYAVVAAALGTVAGLGLAAVLIWGFNFFGDSDVFPPIPFRIEAASLQLAFALGILLTLGTVYIGARRASRLNVVRAIRNLEEPEHIRGGLSLWAGLALFALGLFLSAFAITASDFPASVMGPTFLVLGIGLLLRRRHARRRVYPPLALLLFTYLAVSVFYEHTYETFQDNAFDPIRAVIMGLCLVVIVVYSESAARGLGSLLARIPGLRAVAKPATSYPLHRRFRTGMTLSMFAVILLMVTLFSIFGSIFRPDPEKESGGYDIEAHTTVPIQRLEDHGNNPDLLDHVAYYDVLPFFLQYGGELITVENETTAQFGPPLDQVWGFDEHFAAVNDFQLRERDAAYDSDRDAYLDAARRTDLVIVSRHYSLDEQGNEGAHTVGETLELHVGQSVRPYRIVGIQDQFHYKGIWLPKNEVQTLYPNTDTMILITLEEGLDHDEVAKDFEAAYRDVGMDAVSIRTQILERNESFRQIFTLIQLFLGLGLIIGILSLGIVTARSIIERRQEIGMMRALGFQRRDIRRAFLIEMGALVLSGILIGAAVAFLVSFGVWVTQVREEGLDYVVPWTELGGIALIAFVATMLATLAPIIKASRIPPAEALRYIE